MKRLRASVRLVAGLIWLPGVLLVWSPALLLATLSPARWVGLRARCLQVQTRGILWIMGMRTTAVGQPPRPPFFLVSNHLSYMDVVVLAAQAPCFFVSKAEVADWPVIGWMVRCVGTRFVDRERKGDLSRVMTEVHWLLSHGQGVIFFPEGTSSGGQDVLPFKSSLFQVAVKVDSPVSCASLSYVTPAGSPPAISAVCWWGDMNFTGHLWRMLMLPRIDARVAFAGCTVTAPERKELASRAHDSVRALFVPSGAGGG